MFLFLFLWVAATTLSDEALDGLPARLLTITQVMHRLGVSRATVYRLLASGELPSIALGRSRRVREVALLEFVERIEAAQ